MEDFRSVLIVIPVINEKSNLEVLLPKIFSVAGLCSILIVDDGSNDGTAEWLRAYSVNESVHHVYRNGRFGIGSAHVIGLRHAIDNNYDFCITMDGDQTHDPIYITNILKELNFKGSDIVFTSRFLADGGLTDWSFIRKVLTFLGHFLTFLVFQTRKDLTSGMRGYNVSSLDVEMLNWLQNSHYEFFPMSYYFSCSSSKKISEVPVNLPFRAHGNSKVSIKLLLRNVLFILSTKARYRKIKRGVEW